jgi:hypothetical protein
MKSDSYEFLISLPLNHYTEHNGKSIRIEDLIKKLYPEKIQKKPLTKQEKSKK